MNRMEVGQKIYAYAGMMVTVIRAPHPVTGTRALVEFGGGEREWITITNLYATAQAAQVSDAREQRHRLSIRIRELDHEIGEAIRKLNHLDELIELADKPTLSPEAAP